MQNQLYSSDIAEDSLEAHLNRHSRRSQAIYVGIVVLLLASAALLPVIQVGISVQGAGIVRPETEKHEVRARAAGFADLVPVSENERVGQGQLLLRLRTGPLDVREALVASRLEQLRDYVHDLELLTRGDALMPLSPEHFRSPRYRQEYVQLSNELSEIGLKTERAERELERAQALASQSLIPRSEAEEVEFQLSYVLAERRLLIERYQSGWQAALSGARIEQREFLSQREQIEEESSLYSIESPVAGTIEELARISPGSYVQAGEMLAVISPTTDLIAEAYVTPRDIGMLHVGTPVRVLVDAFNYNDWGFVGGRVVEISDDYVVVNQQPMFRVGIALDRTYLTLRNGFRGELRKGMTLRARFMVTERTLWQLLRDDINDWLNPVGPA